MSDPVQRHAGVLRAVADTYGLSVSAEEAAALARHSAPALQEFRRLAATLTADDDMYAFRRILEDEAARE